MSQLQQVKDAINEFNLDKSQSYVLSNVQFDIDQPEATLALFKGIQPFAEELYEDCNIVISALTKAVSTGANIHPEDFSIVEKWIEAGLEKVPFGKSTICINVARLHSPRGNMFDDDAEKNARFADIDKVKKWLNLAADNADTIDLKLHVVEAVSAEYAGLHLGDKEWASQIAADIAQKLDEKEAKKFLAKAKKIIAL
jgi:hypothetical protein